MGNSESVPEMQMHTSFVLKATPTFSLKRSHISTCKNKEEYFCQQKTRETSPMMNKQSNLKQNGNRNYTLLKNLFSAFLDATKHTGCNPKDRQNCEGHCSLSDLLYIGDVQAQPHIPKPQCQVPHFCLEFPKLLLNYVQLFHFFVAMPFSSLFLPLLCHYTQFWCQPSTKQHTVAALEPSQPLGPTQLMTDIKGQTEKNP